VGKANFNSLACIPNAAQKVDFKIPRKGEEEMDKEDLKEIRHIQSILAEKITSEYNFVRRDSRREKEVAPNIDFGSKEQRRSIHETPCVLWRWFKLSDCRIWADKSESDDGLILQALDNLAKSGRLKFLSIEYKRSMRFGDVGFHVEVGTGVSDFAITDIFKKVTRLYFKEPLKKAERGECILDISGAVNSMREKQWKQIESKFGKTDPHLESRLHREDLEAETQYKSAVIELARSLEKRSEEV
jgi:hypothetical protein